MATKQCEVTLRFLGQPADVNFGGKVHGGGDEVDRPGGLRVRGWLERPLLRDGLCERHSLLKPVLVGSLVEVQAKLIYTGTTSMHVAVDVRAGDLKDQAFARTTHCVIVFVSVNDHGNPTPVAPWAPVTTAEIAEHVYALRLMELRKGVDGDKVPAERHSPSGFLLALRVPGEFSVSRCPPMRYVRGSMRVLRRPRPPERWLV